MAEVVSFSPWPTTVPRYAALAGLLGVASLVLLTRHQLAYWRDTTTLFEHALAVTADNPSAQFSLGVGLENQGDVRKAIVRYRVAISIDPHYGKAFYNMGQVFRKQGLWREAADAYLAAARTMPNDLPTQLNLASVLPHLGRTSEAITHFNHALELDPNSIEALNNLAWLLSTCPEPQTRNGTRAVELAKHGCALTSSKAPFLLGTLAAAYAEAGRFDDAVQVGEQACARAMEMGDLASAARNRELVEVYRASKPYREESLITEISRKDAKTPR
jgi:Tfp pilus assembly protein PilF